MEALPRESAVFEAFSNAMAGALGGVAAFTLIYPLDTVRCRLQAQTFTPTSLSADSNHHRNDNSPSVSSSSSDDEHKSPNPNLEEEEIEDTEHRPSKKRARPSFFRFSDSNHKNSNHNKRQPNRNPIETTIKFIYKTEGLRGFYKALGSALVGIFYSEWIYFFAVTFVKFSLYGKREVKPTQNLLASILAGLCCVIGTTPYWTAQTQLMLQSKAISKFDKAFVERHLKTATKGNGNGNENANTTPNTNHNTLLQNGAQNQESLRLNANLKNGYLYESDEDTKENENEDEKEKVRGGVGVRVRYKNIVHAMQCIAREKGIVGGLYAGIGPAILLVSNPIIQYVCYEEFVNVLKRLQKKQHLSALTYFLCGAVAKAIATYATYPLQVMKTQLQKRDSQYTNMLQYWKFMATQIRAGDIKPLYAGLYAKLYQTVSNTAIKFMIYEKLLEFTKLLLRYLRKMIYAFAFMVFASKSKSKSKMAK